MSVYGMGITVDIPSGTKAQLFERIDQFKRVGRNATIAVGGLAGGMVFLGVVLLLRRRQPRRLSS